MLFINLKQWNGQIPYDAEICNFKEFHEPFLKNTLHMAFK